MPHLRTSHLRTSLGAILAATRLSVIRSTIQTGNQVTRGDGNSTVRRRDNSDYRNPPNPPSIAWDDLNPNQTTRQRILETILIFVCFAAFAGQLPPDINESHYLTKAKYFWDPDWASGDIFLSSSNAHWLFYFVSGWMTQFMSLSGVAWTGRIVTWGLLAFGWQRLSWNLIPTRWMAVVSAILFLLLNDQLHLAGEWVVGGYEAKGLAYFFVLMALGSMLRRDWNWVWPMLGAAMAFHVLVGGWAFVAALIAWVGVNWRPEESRQAASKSMIEQIRSQSLALFAGIAIGLIGVIPPLMSDLNASPETAAAARLIYVNHRIAHHLTFDAFPTLHVARFTVLILFWLLLNRWIRNTWSSMHCRLNPVYLFGIGSLLFSLGGLILSGIAEQSDQLAIDCASLLRFYWFRLSDFAIPASTALACTAIIWYWMKTDSRRRTRLSCMVLILFVVGAFGFTIIKKHKDPRPRADRRWSADFATEPVRAVETYRNWKKVCKWISENTPPDSNFITPADQQTFKWYSERREVVCWKDVPQDANSIIEWRNRLAELYEPQLRFPDGLMSFSDDQLNAMAIKYGATHLVVPQRQVDSAATTHLRQVYPVDPNERSTFVVFEF